MDPHHFGKLHPDPHQSEKQDPDPDPNQSKNVEALNGHFGGLEELNLEKNLCPDLDPHQIERLDPDRHQSDADSQHPC
jgi:hypothetical protein